MHIHLTVINVLRKSHGYIRTWCKFEVEWQIQGEGGIPENLAGCQSTIFKNYRFQHILKSIQDILRAYMHACRKTIFFKYSWNWRPTKSGASAAPHYPVKKQRQRLDYKCAFNNIRRWKSGKVMVKTLTFTFPLSLLGESLHREIRGRKYG